MRTIIQPTRIERFFHKDEVIVSKTDTKGRITYVNRVFMKISGFQEKELLGEPHSVIRHPDMPRCVFKLLWDTLESKKEIFAYVMNICKNGDHYWVLAHVTPSYNNHGEIVGYHSNRRVPNPDTVQSKIVPLYRNLIEEENAQKNRKDGMNVAFEKLNSILAEKGISYEEFIFSLQN